MTDLVPGPFPQTSWSLIHECRDPEDPAATAVRNRLDDLFRRYWPPVYFFVLRNWTADEEEARDLTQAFFLEFLTKDFLGDFKPDRGRFRTFVCAALRHFLSNARRHERAKKRRPEGGLASLDEMRAGTRRFEPDDAGKGDPVAAFDADWKRATIEAALGRLREEAATADKTYAIDLLVRYELDRPVEGAPTYDDLAREFDLPVGRVTSGLRWARKRFIEHLRDEVRDQTASEEDFQAEAGLFGIS